jgi:16S rRNA (cytosine967-C5)-methyltransferase
LVQALSVTPGDTVLDMAMAPGNKTAAIADALARSGRVVASDLHTRRSFSAARRLARMGVTVDMVIADARRPPFRPGTFDRILLDAPCTGLGTLRRRPEIKLRLDPEAPGRLAAVQRQMLEAALPLLRPGGRLVYSVCTVFPEETVEVVAGLGAVPPAELPGRVWSDGRLLAPHLTATDGMFIAVIDG